MYAFPAATACSATAIDAACTSPSPADPNNVYNSDNLGDGAAEQMKITPATAGDWIIVVDSWSALLASGTFTLTVTF